MKLPDEPRLPFKSIGQACAQVSSNAPYLLRIKHCVTHNFPVRHQGHLQGGLEPLFLGFLLKDQNYPRTHTIKKGAKGEVSVMADDSPKSPAATGYRPSPKKQKT
jgi:hypothetical protein